MIRTEADPGLTVRAGIDKRTPASIARHNGNPVPGKLLRQWRLRRESQRILPRGKVQLLIVLRVSPDTIARNAKKYQYAPLEQVGTEDVRVNLILPGNPRL